MENNIDVLDELNKGCNMGMVALNFIIDKVNDFDFRDLLEKQYREYESLASRIGELHREYTDKEVTEVSTVEKIMSWYGIQKDTIMDDSTSKIADLLINGTNMGIIEGRKLLNNKKMEKAVYKLAEEYVKMQEKYIEKLKKFL